MERFVGGPYDGREMPFDPDSYKVLRLPPPDELEDFEEESRDDPGVTGRFDWPHVYRWDATADPPCYRYDEPEHG